MTCSTCGGSGKEVHRSGKKVSCSDCGGSGYKPEDLLDPSNPASPLSPLNPCNPLNPIWME